MSNREKILLYAVGAAVVFGLFSLFWPAGDPDKTAEGTNDVESASRFAARTVAGLNGKQFQQAALTLAKANQPWQGSPFLKADRLPGQEPQSPSQSNPAEPQKDAEGSFVYSGYLASPSKSLAVVNGKEYLEGDQLEASAFIIHEISPDYVKIGKPDGTLRLIPWQKRVDQSDNKQTEPDR